jgi:hypothetical protein
LQTQEDNILEKLLQFDNFDTVKIRKGFNKDEDEFLSAFLNHCMGDINGILSSFMEEENKRIKKKLEHVSDLVKINISIDKRIKEKLQDQLSLCDKTIMLRSTSLKVIQRTSVNMLL